MDQLDKLHHAVYVLEVMENPLWDGLGDFSRVEQLQNAMNEETLKRYSKQRSSEARARQRNFGRTSESTASEVVDFQSWDYASNIMDMICADDEMMLRYQGKVDSSDGRTPTPHNERSLEARIAAIEQDRRSEGRRDYDERKDREKPQGERTGRGRKREREEGEKRKRDQREPPPERKKFDCPCCGEQGHTLSRCVKLV